jgi:hypothetical protein
MSNSPKNQQPSIKETRAHLLHEIQHQINLLKDNAQEVSPLMLGGCVSALESLFNGYLATLPSSYRGEEPHDRA